MNPHTPRPGLKATIRMKLLQAVALALAVMLPAMAQAAADWRYSMGVHDMNVPEVDSNTYGVNAGISLDHRTQAGRHFFGAFDLLLDHDKDHLDPDHVPVWWQLHVGTDGDFWRESQAHVGWTADFNTRINTASSIERQITALPALVGGYDGSLLQASLEAGPGWYFLEIDDDAPREQGYDRSGLRNTTFAYAATAKARLKLGEYWSVSGLARQWQDKQQVLENQYTLEFRGNIGHAMSSHAMQHAELVFSGDFHKYNLDVYNHPNALPVLRWDDDALFRLALENRW